jgi:hypothetical protein
MKTYHAICNVGEGYPSYEFIVRAKTLEEADKITRRILKEDYPENWEYNKDDYTLWETTAEELLNNMIIN